MTKTSEEWMKNYLKDRGQNIPIEPDDVEDSPPDMPPHDNPGAQSKHCHWCKLRIGHGVVSVSFSIGYPIVCACSFIGCTRISLSRSHLVHLPHMFFPHIRIREAAEC